MDARAKSIPSRRSPIFFPPAVFLLVTFFEGKFRLVENCELSSRVVMLSFLMRYAAIRPFDTQSLTRWLLFQPIFLSICWTSRGHRCRLLSLPVRAHILIALEGLENSHCSSIFIEFCNVPRILLCAVHSIETKTFFSLRDTAG